MKPILLALLLVPVLLAAGPSRAGDEFEDGFKDELGRVAAHEAVAVGRGILAQILLGPPAYAAPVYAAPVYPRPYPYPVYAYPYPVYPAPGYWAPYGRHYHHHHHHHHHHHDCD
jgi:hypothetical protein